MDALQVTSAAGMLRFGLLLRLLGFLDPLALAVHCLPVLDQPRLLFGVGSLLFSALVRKVLL
ncbi:MAG: hypothetical protein OXH70_00850 [Acidobacteria bacterium]|nr:hypothetical protein [Acidobacteriota bacterium]